MHHGDALERHHAHLLLHQAERELDRRAGIISILADQLARVTRERDQYAQLDPYATRRWTAAEGWTRVTNEGTDRHDQRRAA